MLSKNKIKYIRSLELKKNRKEYGVFVAEGPKLIGELLNHYNCELIVATNKWLQDNPIHNKAIEIIEVTPDELNKASFLKTPQDVLAIFQQPENELNLSDLKNSLTLILDGIQDPGNMGTIIRIADWFGIEQIICSINTVDVYNPKTIQATMGGIAHVQIHYCDLPEILIQFKEMPIYGTFLDGNNIYNNNIQQKGLIIMGNEGNGISPEVEKLVNHRLYIPNYPPTRDTTESLNVAIATAIVCAEFRRNAK